MSDFLPTLGHQDNLNDPTFTPVNGVNLTCQEKLKELEAKFNKNVVWLWVLIGAFIIVASALGYILTHKKVLR